MKVNIYDRKTKKGALEFSLAAFVDEKIIALKHVDFTSKPDLKKEDVAEELRRFVKMFKEEISETLTQETTDEPAATESENRQHLTR